MADKTVTPAKPSVFGKLVLPDEAWLARAEPEEVLEPQLPIVDTHMHLWDASYGGSGRYFIDDFAREVKDSGHNVEATVYVECHSMYRANGPAHLQPVGETEFAVGQAAMAASGKYTGCRVGAAIVGFADLTQGERTQEALRAHVACANGRFRGIRQRAKWDADAVVRGAVHADGPGLYLRPEFGRGLDVLASMGLVFEASIYHPQLADVAALARAHPQATIVVVHAGSPVGHSSYVGQPVHAQWLAGMRELAACPNAHVKLGGVLMHLANYDFSQAKRPVNSRELADLWRPYTEPCIELFGAERCMVSSNFPVDKAGFSYRTVWNMFKHITSGCSADEKRMLFSGTAKRVYNFD